MKIQGHPTVELRVTLALSEAEAGALDAIAGYGADKFVSFFYAHMGQTYLQPYEAGLCSLFESVRREIPGLLARANEARQCFVRVEFDRLARALGETTQPPPQEPQGTERTAAPTLGELEEFVEIYAERLAQKNAGYSDHVALEVADRNRAIIHDFLRDFEEYCEAAKREGAHGG